MFIHLFFEPFVSKQVFTKKQILRQPKDAFNKGLRTPAATNSDIRQTDYTGDDHMSIQNLW